MDKRTMTTPRWDPTDAHPSQAGLFAALAVPEPDPVPAGDPVAESEQPAAAGSDSCPEDGPCSVLWRWDGHRALLRPGRQEAPFSGPHEARLWRAALLSRRDVVPSSVFVVADERGVAC